MKAELFGIICENKVKKGNFALKVLVRGKQMCYNSKHRMIPVFAEESVWEFKMDGRRRNSFTHRSREEKQDLYQIKEMDQYLESLCPARGMFDKFRIVNPHTNEIFHYQNKKVHPTGRKCYEIWNRDRPCQNCISKRASAEEQQVIKLEYLDGRVNLIWAMPAAEFGGDQFILELAKDVTASMMVSDSMHQDNTDITSLIIEFNELAIKDLFTGLYNKKYIENELPFCLHRAQKGMKLAAAVVDIDRFKLVNDQYGHRTGDQVIKTLAGEIRTAVSCGESWAARMGGDEFLLVFQQMDYPNVKQRCEELADRFSSHSFRKGEREFAVTTSIGLKQFVRGRDREGDFLEQVDQLMYQAKNRRHPVYAEPSETGQELEI